MQWVSNVIVAPTWNDGGWDWPPACARIGVMSTSPRGVMLPVCLRVDLTVKVSPWGRTLRCSVRHWTYELSFQNRLYTRRASLVLGILTYAKRANNPAFLGVIHSSQLW